MAMADWRLESLTQGQANPARVRDWLTRRYAVVTLRETAVAPYQFALVAGNGESVRTIVRFVWSERASGWIYEIADSAEEEVQWNR
jgi:hypothetical protein